MSDDYTNAPPPQRPDEPSATAESGDGRRWKTWHLATAAVVALLLGIAMGGAGGAETDDAGDPTAAGNPAPAETVTVTETATVTSEGEPAPAETVTVTARPTEQAAEEPAEDGDGTYTAGQFTLTDVQVSEDFANDFEVRARITNDGDDVDGVGMSATIFSNGSVVATASGSISDTFQSGQTRTLTLITSDDYTEWDEIEFQVEYTF